MVTLDVMQAARDEYLRRAQMAYASGQLEQQERRRVPGRTDDEYAHMAVMRLELLAAHVLNGGHLDRWMQPVAEPDPRSSLAATLRRPMRSEVVDYSERRWRL